MDDCEWLLWILLALVNGRKHTDPAIPDFKDGLESISLAISNLDAMQA
jgi:hypothetical protein